MGFFERGYSYRAAADEELEQMARRIEKQAKEKQTEDAFVRATAEFQSNLSFAERLNLINAEQAEEYRRRILAAQRAHNRMREEEARTIREKQTVQRQGMNSYTAQIARRRAEEEKNARERFAAHTWENEHK